MLRRLLLSVGLVGSVAASSFGQEIPPPDPPPWGSLPDIGVVPSDYVTAAGTEIGTVLASIFGLFVVLMVVFGSMRWMKRVRSA